MTTHALPEDGATVPCCGTPVLELPPGDRLSPFGPRIDCGRQEEPRERMGP